MVEIQASIRTLQSTPQLASEAVIPASQPVFETPRGTQVQETEPPGTMWTAQSRSPPTTTINSLRTAHGAAQSPVAWRQSTPGPSVASQRGRGASTKGRPRKLGPHEQLLQFD